MAENALCVVNNKLIEGNFKLSAVECRLIMHTISRIGKDDEAFQTYEYTGNELLEALRIGSENHSYLIDVIEGLMKKTVKIRRSKSYLIANWLGGETEVYDDGHITIRFSEKLKPYLLQLKEQFTPLQFESMMKFGSIYASRIYMLCKQYERIRKRTIDIKELKELLQIEKEYKRFTDLKKWVIEPALREINQFSDIRVRFEPDASTRIRKAYRNLVFYIQPLVQGSKKQLNSAVFNKADEKANKAYQRNLNAFKRLSEADRAYWIEIGRSNAFYIPEAAEEYAIAAWISSKTDTQKDTEKEELLSLCR